MAESWQGDVNNNPINNPSCEKIFSSDLLFTWLLVHMGVHAVAHIALPGNDVIHEEPHVLSTHS